MLQRKEKAAYRDIARSAKTLRGEWRWMLAKRIGMTDNICL
jgi:hypothetical protein